MNLWLHKAGAWVGRNIVAPYLEGLLDEVEPVVVQRFKPKNLLKGLFGE